MPHVVHWLYWTWGLKERQKLFAAGCVNFGTDSLECSLNLEGQGTEVLNVSGLPGEGCGLNIN